MWSALDRIVLVLACGLLLLLSTSDGSLDSYDPFRPTTLLPIVTIRLQALYTKAPDLRVRERLDAATAALRERLHQ